MAAKVSNQRCFGRQKKCLPKPGGIAFFFVRCYQSIICVSQLVAALVPVLSVSSSLSPASLLFAAFSMSGHIDSTFSLQAFTVSLTFLPAYSRLFNLLPHAPSIVMESINIRLRMLFFFSAVKLERKYKLKVN